MGKDGRIEEKEKEWEGWGMCQWIDMNGEAIKYDDSTDRKMSLKMLLKTGIGRRKKMDG